MPARRTGAGTQAPKEWEPDQLNALLASARTMPGDVAGIPARLWWPALLLVVLDTATSPRDVLRTEKRCYDRARGTLAIGLMVYQLHPHTIEALERIVRHEHARLLPWPWDRGGDAVHCMLLRRMKELVYRAGLPHVSQNLFERLRVTARRVDDVLSRIDPLAVVSLRNGKPHHPRKRDVRRWESANLRPTIGDPNPDVYLIEAASSRMTALQFFEQWYRPRRLSRPSRTVLQKHHFAIREASYMKGAVLTVDQFCDDLIEEFLIWLADTPEGQTRQNTTINGYAAALVAQWRYAWKKKLVDEPPRDVEYLPVPKRLPKAWTPDELARLFATAAAQTGQIGDIPAAVFWPALLLTMYDTGLRVTALCTTPMADVDLQNGWLWIRAERQKQQADQCFELHPETIAQLCRLPADREMLLPLPIQLPALRERLHRLLQRAGLPHTRLDLFHKMRKTSGTMVAAVAGEQAAQRHLGHSSVQMTRRYLDPRLIKRPSVVKLIERPPLLIEEGDVA